MTRILGFAFILFVFILNGIAFGQSQEKVVWNFGGYPADGANSVSNLISDNDGNLYGTTRLGGNQTGCHINGCGTVFELSPQTDGTWQETVLYNFCSSGGSSCLDGYMPEAGLVLDEAGNLYGTTFNGGAHCCGGTVFELSPPQLPGGAWTYTVLYNFCSVMQGNVCEDGSGSHSQLAIDAVGNLYGTTTAGGSGHNTQKLFGNGTVFELSPSANGWTETVLYSFCTQGLGNVCPDGDFPNAGVTFDKAGNLFGTTEFGGGTQHLNAGTLYKLWPENGAWKQTVLVSFYPSHRGFPSPAGSVSIDPAGNLYSTTSAGGMAGGSVFRLSPKAGTIRQLFFNGTNGETPLAGVILDLKRSAAYGTTSVGGVNQSGTVFAALGSGQMSAIYAFCSEPNCVDGSVPQGSLIEDSLGNLYGTTYYGGTSNNGVVFEIVP